jgi:hypothetical protein
MKVSISDLYKQAQVELPQLGPTFYEILEQARVILKRHGLNWKAVSKDFVR